MGIPVVVTGRRQHRRGPAIEQRCRSCGVRYELVRLWGIPIRAMDAVATWTCPSCGTRSPVAPLQGEQTADNQCRLAVAVVNGRGDLAWIRARSDEDDDGQ
jgi:hypothetical protein